jgi:hypothetical protein
MSIIDVDKFIVSLMNDGSGINPNLYANMQNALRDQGFEFDEGKLNNITNSLVDVDGMVAAYEERIPALTPHEERKRILDIYRGGIVHTLNALKCLEYNIKRSYE